MLWTLSLSRRPYLDKAPKPCENDFMKWVRSEDGALFGVCKGMAKTLDMPVGVVRVLLILSIIFFGMGLGVYLLLAMALPRADKLNKAMEPRILGVCVHYSKKLEIEIGLMRFVALLLLIGFSILTLVGYFVAYLMLPDEEGKSSVSRNNPSVPPSTV